MLLVFKNTPNLALFCLSGFGLINFDTHRNEFPVMFNIFVNMFWKAEYFGCIWMLFELGSFTNLCLVFKLDAMKK